MIFVRSGYIKYGVISRKTPTGKFNTMKETDFACLALEEENLFNTLTGQEVERLCIFLLKTQNVSQ